MIVIQI